ncbi:MAG: TOBE domain-containing protein, partial [Pseudomonadota bacterium]
SSGSVTLGIRPRAFSVRSEADDSTITVTSEITEPMGAETLVHARTKADAEIRVVIPRQNRVAIGETLHLAPDPGQTHIFDSTGKAVR